MACLIQGAAGILQEFLPIYPAGLGRATRFWCRLSKWHWGVSQNASVEPTGEVSVGEHKGQFGTTVKSSPDVYRATTSLDPISRAPLLEAFTRLTRYPKPIYQVKLESGLVTENNMLPMGHCQVLPSLCPLQAETALVGSQKRLLCGFISMVTTR